MELLYTWIYQTDNHFIEKQGFNFSPIHRFAVKREEECYKLQYEKTDTMNICIEDDANNIVSNITSIVGKNGAGKTSLLRYIYSSLMPHPRKVRKDTLYMMSDIDWNEQKKSIWIFLDSNNEIQIYYYLDNDNLIVDKTLKCNIHVINTENIRTFINKNIAYTDITTVYLTNSTYQSLDGYELKTNLSKCALTPVSLRFLSNSFYNTIAKINDKDFLERFKQLQSIIKEKKSENDFQQICDILFFGKLLKKNMIDNYAAKISTDLIINFNSLMNFLLDKYPDFPSINEDSIEDDNIKSLHKLHIFTNRTIGKCSFVNSNSQSFNYFINLYVSLFMEILFTYGISDSFEEINDIDIKDIYEFIAYIENLIKKYRDESIIQYDYFIQALQEIKEIDALLFSEPQIEDSLPGYDLAKRHGIIVSYDRNEDVYAKFLEFIRSSFMKNNSFILKYIDIGNLAMSSGERAFQNFFSWLNLLPDFNCIDSNVIKSLKKNILLLIDEIDLYLHPDWQRKIVDFLIDELNSQFGNHKVQVILATHSPIVLSDIPKMNTIYLYAEDNRLVVDENSNHTETFAANIYNILDDSFYIDNTMGEYAKGVIDKIIKSINSFNSETTFDQYIECMKRINIIGETILNKKLKEMLISKMGPHNELVSLMREKSMIEEKIKKLKEMRNKNDTYSEKPQDTE